MRFGFALELSDIDLWNTDLLDTHLDLLSRDKYTGIPSKYFVCLHKIFKRSSRHVFKTSSRRLQRNNFSSSKTSWRRLQDQQMFCWVVLLSICASYMSWSKSFVPLKAWVGFFILDSVLLLLKFSFLSSKTHGLFYLETL